MEKEMLAIVERLNQFWGILFVNEINTFSDDKNMFYATTLIEYKMLMFWQPIIEYFGPNIQHIAGIDNIVSDTLSRLPSMPSDNYEPCTKKAQCWANDLLSIGRLENNEDFFPLNILIVQIEQQK